MQTVLLFAPLLLGNALIDSSEINIAAGFLLALVPFRANLIQLFVVVAVALEAADVVEAPLIGVACRKRLDGQIKGDHPIIAHGARLSVLAVLALILIPLAPRARL